MSFEIESSLEAYPLPWTVRDLRPGSLPYERFLRLPPSARAERLAKVSRSTDEDPSAETIYESQQPPLYYWLMAPVLAASEYFKLALPARVAIIRGASILLCSLALPVGWALARSIFRSDSVAVGVVAAAVAMPGLMIDMARVGNEALAILVYTVLAYLCVLVFGRPPSWRTTLLTGAALGAGLLTKSYFLTAIPAIIVVFLWARSRQALIHLSAALALAAGASWWWYGFIYHATGDLTGQIQSVALRSVPLAERLTVALHMNWLRTIDTAMFSHIWFGGWSFLQLRSWMYHVFYLVFFAGVAGLVAATVRGHARALLPVAVLEICFCASLGYHAVLGQIGHGMPMTNGWYLYCLVFPELILLCSGLMAFAPGRYLWRVPALLAALFALLDLYGLSIVQLPYYTGILEHATNGRLRALKPAELPALAAQLDGFWATYLAATISTVAIAFAVRSPDRMPATPVVFAPPLPLRALDFGGVLR
ncbi:MAG: glycosyltransferase family 39 protein [Bryobacterales bacterium]|nr:glycosyltransferase family 39 protein [Bryobacterales bacterium]